VPAFEAVVVAGSNGGFGRLLAPLLAEVSAAVVGVDLAPEPDGTGGLARYLAADVARPSDELLAAVREASVLLLCVPEDAALQAIERLAGELPPGGLLVDTLSVKTPVAEAVERFRGDVEVLSLNPLFAPDLGLAGRSVAAVRLRPGPRSDAFLALLAERGAEVSVLSAAEHDRQAAATQVATHAVLLALGLFLEHSSYAPSPALAPPPHWALLSLLARVVTNDPETYRRIQLDNPHAAAVRDELARNLRELDERIREPHGLDELFASLRSLLDPALPELLERSRRALSDGRA
jgi:4-amino-4-deoxyprephenate dehydrogenase